MTVSDPDIWRSAILLIQKHGDKAWTEACSRYFDLKDKGDIAGMTVWRRIAKAISDFTDTSPEGELN